MSERSLSTGKTAALILVAVIIVILGLLLHTQLIDKNKLGKCEPKKGVLTKLVLHAERPKVPNNIFVDSHQKSKRLSDYRGRGLVVNFWATWCLPCVKEMPHLDRLRTKVKSFNIDVLAVSEDKNGAGVVRNFYADNKLKNLEIFIDRKGDLLRALGGRGLPTTLLIDQHGLEIGRLLGVAEWDAPETIQFLKRCLES